MIRSYREQPAARQRFPASPAASVPAFTPPVFRPILGGRVVPAGPAVASDRRPRRHGTLALELAMFGSIGMPELIIILVIALIIFGPRKLPELGKSLGKSINEFKKASTELQNTLEQEIKLEEQKEERARSAAAAPTPAPAPAVLDADGLHGQPVSRGEGGS
jgi:sec-independent protein translocase protein TatA